MTQTKNQLKSKQLIYKLLHYPNAFLGKTLSPNTYDFSYQDLQTGHTLFSALMQAGNYTCAKNILAKLPEKKSDYDDELNQTVLAFCNLDKCGPMGDFLKRPCRFEMKQAGIPLKTRDILGEIAKMLQQKLSLDIVTGWSEGERPFAEPPFPISSTQKPTTTTYTADPKPAYTSAGFAAQALEEREDMLYERELAEQQKQKKAEQQKYEQAMPAQKTISDADEELHQTTFNHLLFPSKEKD